MRIAIAGASGTGKTTLALAIAERYGIPMNPIGARSVALEMGFGSPYDVDQAGKRAEFQRRLFEAKRDWERDHEAFVTDRSVLDNLAYTGLHVEGTLEHEEVVQVFLQAARRYDMIVRVWKKDFQRLDDGIRNTDPAYHDFYELILGGLISRARVAVVDLHTGDMETRQARVFRALDSFQRLLTEN